MLAWGQLIPEIDCLNNRIICRIAKLESITLPLFYGTAVLFDWDDTHFWFMTSAHLMSRNEIHRQALRLRSPLLQYADTPVEFIGEDRGGDIAVIRVRRADTDEMRKRRAIFREDFSAVDGEHREVRISILGFPGTPDTNKEIRPALRDEMWTVHENRRITLVQTHRCPVPFLENCYRLPILSWGFSGGALLGDKEGVTRVYGIVSHFSPLGGETYFIPAGAALRMARNIVENRGSINTDERGYFRFVGQAIEIRKGALSGKFVTVPKGDLFAEGGDESSGGGDESSGGGDESSGGGDESSGGGGEFGHSPSPTLTIRNERGNIARLEDYSKIERALQFPEEWKLRSNPIGSLLPYFYSFKGIRSWLEFEPGVNVDSQRVYGMGNRSLGSLQQFLMTYRVTGAFDLRYEMRPVPLPSRLETRAGDLIPGLFALASIRRFKSAEELRAMLGNFTRNDVGFELKNELETLITGHAAGKGDLTIGQVTRSPLWPMRTGLLVLGENAISGTFSDGDGGTVELSFSSDFKAIGDYFYKHIGEVWVSEQGGEKRSVRGILSLQWDPERSLYEFRAFWAYSAPERSQEPGGFLSQDHIHLRALSADLHSQPP